MPFPRMNRFYWASWMLLVLAGLLIDNNSCCFVRAFLILPSKVSLQRPCAICMSSPLSQSNSESDKDDSLSNIQDETNDLLAVTIDDDLNSATNSTGNVNLGNNSSSSSNSNSSSSSIKSNSSKAFPFVVDRPIMVTGDQVGIGGKDGVRPDVNKLKRNLVQESVQQYKNELLMLLGTPSLLFPANPRKDNGSVESSSVITKKISRKNREDIIEEKIAALLEVNPVTTTTDSNILDGLWEFTLVVETTPAILNSLRFVLKNNPKFPKKRSYSALGSPFRLKNQKIENPFRESKREINLENLGDNEDPYVLDSTSYFNGLLRIETRYRVVGLTRTSLDIAVESITAFTLDKKIRSKEFVGIDSVHMQILYLDTDLFMATSCDNKGVNGPLHVYTKSDIWHSRRKVRQFTAVLAWMNTAQSPLRLRQRIRNQFSKDKASSSTNGGSRVGDLADNLEDDYLAWDGDEDPFVHLSATERQELLRSMSIHEIEEAWEKKTKDQEKETKSCHS